MAWLWTDTLAALLVEHDRVEGLRLAAWVERPEAYRLPEGREPIDLARDLLRGEPGSALGAAALDRP
ncbi:MAG: hypothetical protein ABIJ48_04160 [Actinomycetota bacterium]